MAVRDNNKYKKLIAQVGKCELCGSRRRLEVHHIIPLVCSIDGVDLDCDDNLICVCAGCHGKLTSRSLLTKYALHMRMNKSQYRLIKFYETLNQYEGDFNVIDVLDLVDDTWGCKNE